MSGPVTICGPGKINPASASQAVPIPMASIDLNQAELAGFAIVLVLNLRHTLVFERPAQTFTELNNFGDRFACDQATGAAIIRRLHQFAGGEIVEQFTPLPNMSSQDDNLVRRARNPLLHQYFAVNL